MVTPDLIAQLKQVNVSRDKGKTQERVKSAFSAASRKEKQAIEKLTGQKRTSIYRVYKTGSISAKILLPIAEILDITPYWFTGETDEREACSDAIILSFIEAHGYKFSPKKTVRGGKSGADERSVHAHKGADELAGDDEDTITVSITLSNTPQMQAAVERLDAESAGQLLQALYLRAKAGGNAEQLWDVVKLCLLS